MNRQFQISALAVVILVLLRVAIGWHFLHEGLWKYREPNFTAEPYLRQARGPLANLYRGLVPDFFGEERLDGAAMKDRWTQRQQQAAEHYGFGPSQRKEAQRLLGQRFKEYEETLWENKTDADGREVREKGQPVRVVKEQLRWYEEGLAKWREDEAKRETHDIPFQRKRHFDDLTKLQQDVKPWLDEIDRMDKDFRTDLVRLASDEQRETVDALPEKKSWLATLETLTTYSLIAMGICLMLGFATRLAALGGAVFLLSAVVLPQLAWPTTYPPPPPSAGHSFLVNKEVIEMLVLLMLSFTPVGRWAGLDYIGHALFTRYYGTVGDFVTRYAGKLLSLILSFVKRLLRKETSHAPDS